VGRKLYLSLDERQNRGNPNLIDHTALFVRERLTKVYKSELIWLILENPVCRIAHVVEAGLAGRQNASRYLKELSRIGVLWEQGAGREKFFVHTKLMELLTRDKTPLINTLPTGTVPKSAAETRLWRIEKGRGSFPNPGSTLDNAQNSFSPLFC
jgi:hypothetical protein